MFQTLQHIFTTPWVLYTAICIYLLTVVSIVAVIISENRNPVKSLAWLTVLFLQPVLGIVFYLFFGRSIKNKRMISRRNRRKLRRQESTKKFKTERKALSDEESKVVQLGRNMSRASYYPGNHVDIYTNGADKFEALFQDIADAKKYINLQYYIIKDDNIGTRLKDALIAKARQGVTVRVIYDHVGSFDTRSRFFKEMSEAGVQTYPFFKVTFPGFGTRLNWRNHRKLCIIDGEKGYIGGMNVADRYIDGGKKFETWRDTHLRIQGPAVAALQYSFAVDWNFMGQPLIEEEVNAEEYTEDAARMQLLTSGPMSQWTNIAFLFIKAISGAKKRVLLQTPYFLPNEALLHVLQTMALSGVDVRLMMPLHSDSKMLTLASASYVEQCLQAGIKIYLYERGMLHCKALIVDDDFVSVGSTNFDFRSFEHNFEANMQIYSKSVCQRMTEIFMHDLRGCQRVNAQAWKKRSKLKKGLESTIRLLSPIL